MSLWKSGSSSFARSQLYDDQTFYSAFEQDMLRCRREVVIESPFITPRRLGLLAPSLRRLTSRGVKLVVDTRHPLESDECIREEIESCIVQLQGMGAEVLFTGKLHRKLAIIDREILWEGSLNILSQSESCEIMRRIADDVAARHVLSFTRLVDSLRK